MEVQAVLDFNLCPIVQIIDDDKGVHIVAAVNCNEAVPEMCLWVLKCVGIVEKGATVGVATGPTFVELQDAPRHAASHWSWWSGAARLMHYCSV
jgi:hypothetical protein